MATFLLVHGGLHGGWCWKKVSPILRQAGHDVHAITLTGNGERYHLRSPSINLDTHIDDVLGVIKYEELDSIILVGHSYGGMVISGVADAVPEKISHLIYLDAIVPFAGESVLDVIGAPVNEKYREIAQKDGDGWLLRFSGAAERYGVHDPADVAWLDRMLTPHSFASMAQPIKLKGLAESMPKTFIRCVTKSADVSDMSEGGPGRSYKRALDLGWPIVEISSGHDVMITEPRKLSDILIRIGTTDKSGSA